MPLDNWMIRAWGDYNFFRLVKNTLHPRSSTAKAPEKWWLEDNQGWTFKLWGVRNLGFFGWLTSRSWECFHGLEWLGDLFNRFFWEAMGNWEIPKVNLNEHLQLQLMFSYHGYVSSNFIVSGGECFLNDGLLLLSSELKWSKLKKLENDLQRHLRRYPPGK